MPKLYSKKPRINLHSILVCFTDPFSLSFSLQLYCALIFNHKTNRFPSHYYQGEKGVIEVVALHWAGRPPFRTFFLPRASRFSDWAVLVLNGQMNWHIILIFTFILISKRDYQSRLIALKKDWSAFENTTSRAFSHLLASKGPFTNTC